MDAHPALRSLALLLAPLPILLVALPRSESPSGIAEAFAPSIESVTSPTLADREVATMQRYIAQREYWASEDDGKLQAPNRAHNLRIYFESDGIRVHDRAGNGSSELLALNLTGIGRGEALADIGPGEVASHGTHVEIQRQKLIEWYENSASGLEQGFTLIERPEGEGLLRLEMSVSGARATPTDGRVVFVTNAGRRLEFGKLAAIDAAGSPASASFAMPDENHVQIVIEDSEAAYPLTIDPLLTETADALLESNEVSAFLGWSVSGAGDVNGDGYDDVIVGAMNYDGGQAGRGAAFVFLGTPDGIANGNPLTAHVQIESNQFGALLGRAVAGAGDVNGDGYDDILVGSRYYDAGETDEGAAFLFLGSAAGITNGNLDTANAKFESNQAGAFLGDAVSSAGDVNGDGYDDVIVGSGFYDAGQDREGIALVFLGSAEGIADGNPNNASALLESNRANAFFGGSVSGAGDVNGDGYDDVIVGASRYSITGSSGAAFLFLGGAAGIADGNPATADTQILGGLPSGYLGFPVSGAGDVNGDGYDDILIGAERYLGAGGFLGAAFVYLGSASGIPDGYPSTANATLESDQDYSGFGSTCAGVGDVNGDGYDDVIVGASYYDEDLENEYEYDHGAAFVFLGGAGGIADGNPSIAYAHLKSNQPYARLGFSASSAGDVNGDGFDDVIVGAPYYTEGEENEGVALVFLPEPSTAASLVSSAALLGWLYRRRQNPI